MKQCGDCGMCCKLLHVREIDKPSGTWCKFYALGQGCTIYSARPTSCQQFECMWLQEESMPEELKPNKSHVVLWVTEDGKILIASVDPHYPDSYKKGEMGRLLQSMLEVSDHKIGIIIGKERFPLLPNVEIPHFYDEAVLDDKGNITEVRSNDYIPLSRIEQEWNDVVNKVNQ